MLIGLIVSAILELFIPLKPKKKIRRKRRR